MNKFFLRRSPSARSWSCTPPWSPLAYSPTPGSPPLQHEKVCILRTSIRSKWGAWLGSREAFCLPPATSCLLLRSTSCPTSCLPQAFLLPTAYLLSTSCLPQAYLRSTSCPTSCLPQVYLLPTGYKLSTALSTSQSIPTASGGNS